MKKICGKNVRVSTDSTGGVVSVDWNCPYCGEFNPGFYFSRDARTMRQDFEIDHACEWCGKMVTIICTDTDELFN